MRENALENLGLINHLFSKAILIYFCAGSLTVEHLNLNRQQSFPFVLPPCFKVNTKVICFERLSSPFVLATTAKLLNSSKRTAFSLVKLLRQLLGYS